MNQSFLIVGVAKNCKKTLAKTLDSIYRVLPRGSSKFVFIVESDSTDDTIGVLTALKSRDPNVEFVSLGNLSSTEPDRIRRIATCRNVYLEKLESMLSTGQKIDFIVIADLDGVNSRIYARCSIEKLLSESKVISANQRSRYYDILALRKQGWVEEDYRISSFTEVSLGKDPLVAYIHNVSMKQRKIRWSSPNIPVDSAFGGLAFYPSRAVSGLRYAPQRLSPDIYECEHVSLNSLVRQRGFGIEIAPSLQNSGSFKHTQLAFAPFRDVALLAGLFRKVIQGLRK
jgi:glycosyltransferase involved in cell wall biosynthesis